VPARRAQDADFVLKLAISGGGYKFFPTARRFGAPCFVVEL